MPNNKTSEHKYLIAKSNISPLQCEALEKWITGNCFEQYESPEHTLSSIQNRSHNNLYKFILPATNYQVVMKVTHTHKQYNWTRRLRALLRHYLQRDANYKAFQCCRKAHRYNLASPKPLAYWQKRDSLTQVKSYFLYQYTENSVPWLEVCKQLKETNDIESQQWRNLLKEKIIEALKNLHRADIRHGDMTAHNILISVQNTECLSDAKVYFIDYDRGTFARLTKPAWLKRFFDLRDLRKIYIDDAAPDDVLAHYLGNDCHSAWRAVLAFWQLGQSKNYNRNV